MMSQIRYSCEIQMNMILRSKVPCKVSFCTMKLDARVHAGGGGGGGGGLGQNLVVSTIF